MFWPLVLAPALAHGEARTWIGCDEVVGGFSASGSWSFWGTGLVATRELSRPLSIGAEAQLVRVDIDGPRSDHGFAVRSAVVADYAVLHSPARLNNVHFDLDLELGAGAATIMGIGANRRSEGELFTGVRAAFHETETWVPAGSAQGLGGYVALRYGRMGSGEHFALVVGYDWGF
jgi:hypothetical protein